MKKIITLLNILIFFSLFILPAIIVLVSNNILGIANSIKVDEPTQSFKNNSITISSILTVRNPGPFNIEGSITASVKGDNGTQIDIMGPHLLVTSSSQEQRIPIPIKIDLSTLSENYLGHLASNSENFTIEVSAQMGIPSIISLTAEATAHVNWLPPMSNLSIGQPILENANKNQITVEVPFSFENKSPFFAFDGEGMVSVFDSSEQQVGQGILKISSQPMTKWGDSVKIMLPLPADFEKLLLNNSTFRYRTEEIFSLNNFPITPRMVQNITIDWGAPIDNRKISTSFSPANSTYTRATASLSFINNNRFITADGSVTTRLVNDLGQSWVSNTQPLYVAPGGSASLNFDVVFPNNLLMNGSPRLILRVDTQIGSIDLEATSLG